MEEKKIRVPDLRNTIDKVEENLESVSKEKFFQVFVQVVEAHKKIEELEKRMEEVLLPLLEEEGKVSVSSEKSNLSVVEVPLGEKEADIKKLGKIVSNFAQFAKIVRAYETDVLSFFGEKKGREVMEAVEKEGKEKQKQILIEKK